MLIASPGRLDGAGLDRPWLCPKRKLAVNKVLAMTRGDKTETLAVRYVSDTEIGWTTPHAFENTLAAGVTTRGRPAYDVYVDDKPIRRPPTRPGALNITDFRVPACADLRGIPLDNTVVFIPLAALHSLADDLRVPRVQTVQNLFAEDHVDDAFLHLIEILKDAIERPAEANAYFIEHIFSAMCAHIATRYGGMAKPNPHRRGTLSPLQERRVKAQLLEHLAEPPSLESLAASCSLSRSHFSRAFKESTGLPPHQWLLAERVKRAKELLQATQVAITEIALECGFADQSHLTRAFSKAVGISPAAWRRNGRD